MKYCAKCGKEVMDEAMICPSCGCAVQKEKKAAKQTYEDAIRNAGTFVAIGTALLALGIVVGLFVSVLLGAILCLAAELVAVMPNTKVQKLFKQNNSHIADKKQLKADEKALRKELKKKNGAYAASFVIAMIALVGVVVFALMI